MDEPRLITQHDGAKRDGFDQAAGAVDNGNVTDPDLIFQQEKKAADQVAHQMLRAEPDRQPDHPSAGEYGTDIDTHLAESDENDDEPQKAAADGPQDARERSNPFNGSFWNAFGSFGRAD